MSGELMNEIERHPCDRAGCTSNATNHYHCGRCTSSEVTSMMGHYRRETGRGEYYTCKPEDLPAKDVVGCPCGNYEADEEDCTECKPTVNELTERLDRMAAENVALAAKVKLLDANTLKLVGQVVTTEAELEALPDETVIVGRGDKYDNEYSDTDWCPWQKNRAGLWRSWAYVDGFSSHKLVTVKFLPVRYTVVWMPPVERCDAVVGYDRDGQCQKAAVTGERRCSVHRGDVV